MIAFRPLLLTAIAALTIASATAAEEQLFFERDGADGLKTVFLRIDGNDVSGRESWAPKDQHGASGDLEGKRDGELIKVTYTYSIEGSDQTEEQVFKLDGDDLLEGSGELNDPKDNGNLVLKNPAAVTFETRLKKVPVSVPAEGSPERTAIEAAMEKKVLPVIGQPVDFSGDLLVADDWARFQGNAAISNGNPPKDEMAQNLLEMDYFALLRKDSDGNWSALSEVFSGDVGRRDDAIVNYPESPWVLFE